MNSSGRTVRETWARAVLVVGVVACLCFSAGEGLRLTPLPSLPPVEVGPTELQASVTLARAAHLNRTGPLDVPAQGQAQKRGKRQAPECECPPSVNARELPFQQSTPSGTDGQPVRASRLLVARPPGRAPPHAS